jgi:hypothetical protein
MAKCCSQRSHELKARPTAVWMISTKVSPWSLNSFGLSQCFSEAVWTAAGESGPFGAIIKLLILTAQRKDKVATMKWDDLEGDVWTIATEPREKGNAIAGQRPTPTSPAQTTQQRSPASAPQAKSGCADAQSRLCP